MNGDKETDRKKTRVELANIPQFKTNPFGQNFSGAQAFKRTERIAFVIYILTNSVPEHEPIRARVRKQVHNLLSSVLSLRGGLRAAGDERISAVSADARELISLVWMLHIAGYLSQHNAGIVMQAVDDLEQFVRNARSSYLSEDLTLSEEDVVPPVKNVVHREDVDKSHVSQKEDHPRAPRGRHSKGQIVRNRNSNRQDTILDILRRSGELGIKDISSQIVGFSEKTLQRELSALVSKGLVHKKGKKRWSTYIAV